MKKNSSMQGTFSRLFGKKHGNSGNSSTTSLYVTNPPWVFTQEVSSDKLKSSGDIDGIYYGDNRFGSVTDSGTATLKARPRVRPLLTFLPLSAQEAHGVAVPTPSVPEGFEEKASLGLGSQINGGYRKYNSVLDLRSKAFDEDYFNNEDIPPPPSVPPPPPPSSIDIPSPPPPLVEVPPPPPSVEAPPPPPSVEAPPPPPMVPPPAPPTKPVVSPSFLAPSSYPYSNVSSPSTPSPPDFIPPPPPLAFMDDASPLVPPPPPPLPFNTPPFSNGVSKWKSETVLNIRQSENSLPNLNLTSPPTPNQKESQLLRSSPEPHLTFPRSLKVPPPTPVRTSSMPSGEKESSPQEEELLKMVFHSRPALPSSFTIQTATMVHSKGEAGEKAALEKPSILITDNSKVTSDSNGSSTSSLKHEVSVAEETKFPTPESASSDDDDWKERTNLDKLKHELSALLSSSCRKDDRQPERTVIPKTKTSNTDGNQGSTDELKRVKPAVTGPQLPIGTESERKEKTSKKAPSPGKAFTGDALPAADSKSTTIPTNSVMKFRNELEAVLSPTKDGGPPLALANLRHKPETKKQVTLQFGGSQSRVPKLPTNQNPAMSELTKKVPESPGASSGKSPSGNTGKLPASPLKQKNEPVAPAAPSPLSSGTTSPVRTASPNMDFSLLQYKTHRTRFGSVDSLGSGTSSQTTEDGPVNTNNVESQRDSAESMSSRTSTLSRNTEQANNHVLFHPVTGEKVERGSPMALLLAAQQRAQKGRCSSATTSRQNSYVSEKPSPKLSEKLLNSTQLETGSSSSSTIYYSDSKPNTVTVVPKSPQRASHAVLESKQPNGPDTSESKIWSTSGLGQREHKPYSSSSASEQCRNVQQLRESESQNPPAPNRSGASVFKQALAESSHLKQQGLHSTPETSLSSVTVPQSHTQSNNDDVDVGFNYEIIPPPPEFSNDAIRVTDGFSNGQDSLKGLTPRRDDQVSDKQPSYNNSRYSYGNSYPLTPKSALESSTKPSGYSHHYPGGTYSTGYLGSYSNSRPLIKKRLYVSDSDKSYGRSSMTSRSMSTPTTYGHNTMAYNSQVAEGMRRMNPGHRNVPNSAQGRRVSLELPGTMVTYNNPAGDIKYRGQNGEYPTNVAAASRPSHGSQQYGGTANTFTVRPGTRQPISYSHQGGLR
ncbi:uncharacterized protein C6orf132 homolog [Tiliqua scincoides]|uniref:uncharacterized protein C6orf132 homolog n=1 Tax=Tiliqua scincoides TaxID=71010 RepID=UPI003461E89A